MVSTFKKIKWLYTLSVALSIFLAGCSAVKSKIIYVFEKNNGVYEFDATITDTVIKQSINFRTMEINPGKNEPVLLDFIFSETPPNAEKLKSINVSLTGKSENGGFDAIPSSSELKIEYSNGKGIVSVNKKNNSAQLNQFIDWKDVNYTYTFLEKEYLMTNNPVTYTFSYRFQTENYPDTLKLNVELIWENGQRKYETLLHKEKYKGPKLNLKY